VDFSRGLVAASRLQNREPIALDEGYTFPNPTSTNHSPKLTLPIGNTNIRLQGSDDFTMIQLTRMDSYLARSDLSAMMSLIDVFGMCWLNKPYADFERALKGSNKFRLDVVLRAP